MHQTSYQKESKLFFAMAAELRHAYREGGSPEEVAELIDEIDTFSRYTEHSMLRERCAEMLLLHLAGNVAGGTA